MTSTGRASRRGPDAGRAGFTLIEVVAAVFLTSIVIGVALAFFVGLSRSTEAAAAKTQHGRRAFAVLDRIARDLEGAYLLVKPPAVDPLLHPWLFVAESQFSTDGADRVKFTSRSYRPRNPIGHGSDLGVVTYMLHPADDGRGYELLRSIVPGLPEALEREFPSYEDDSVMLVAEGLSHFGIRFLSDTGEWQTEWDSTLIAESSALPLVAEIELAFVPGGPEEDETRRLDEFEFAGEDDETETFVRTVKLPMRPVDLAAMLEAGAPQAGEEPVDELEEELEGEEGDGTQADGDRTETLGDEGGAAPPNTPVPGGALVPGLGGNP